MARKTRKTADMASAMMTVVLVPHGFELTAIVNDKPIATFCNDFGGDYDPGYLVKTMTRRTFKYLRREGWRNQYLCHKQPGKKKR